MEFSEKLQDLRKNRGLTQEELAEALYVSRTAISKWESGRGYPNIDSLKEISSYFSVTIDELLSADKIISIAEKEQQSKLRTLIRILFGMVDLASLLLVVLPLYPKTVDGFVYSVNLLSYTETTACNRIVYWGMFLALILLGVWNVSPISKGTKLCAEVSMFLGTVTVLFLAFAGETYAIAVAFLLLIVKTFLLQKIKIGCSCYSDGLSAT